MLNSYLSILEDSLKKKLAVLEQIDEVSDVQTALLKEETFDLERFDATVNEKDAFIKQLSELDDGFETLYEKVREELLKDRRQYEQQIGRMQKLIGQITDKSVSRPRKAGTRRLWSGILQEKRRVSGRTERRQRPPMATIRI